MHVDMSSVTAEDFIGVLEIVHELEGIVPVTALTDNVHGVRQELERKVPLTALADKRVHDKDDDDKGPRLGAVPMLICLADERVETVAILLDEVFPRVGALPLLLLLSLILPPTTLVPSCRFQCRSADALEYSLQFPKEPEDLK